MHFFSSITVNYIPKARVLANSIKKFHPEGVFHLVLSDAVPDWFDIEKEPFDTLITLEELPIPKMKPWVFSHELVEVCTGVKGLAMLEIFRRYDADNIFYFDPDIVVFSRLDQLLELYAEESILLTPHLIDPETEDGAILDNEIYGAMQHGIYNLGFLGVKNSPEGIRFAQWWAERLQKYCVDDIPRGLFTDQKWCDFVPAFFDEVAILREPHMNVATWNITKRNVTGSMEDGIFVNGKPLVFYHFSGFDSGAQKTMLGKYGADNSALWQLRDWYIKECEKHGHTRYGKTPCKYATFDNGVPIQYRHRVTYRNQPELISKFPDPFKTSPAEESYLHWCEANMEEYSSPGVTTPEGLRAIIRDLSRELKLLKQS